jgi:hypothetical protein
MAMRRCPEAIEAESECGSPAELRRKPVGSFHPVSLWVAAAIFVWDLLLNLVIGPSAECIALHSGSFVEQNISATRKLDKEV